MFITYIYTRATLNLVCLYIFFYAHLKALVSINKQDNNPKKWFLTNTFKVDERNELFVFYFSI